MSTSELAELLTQVKRLLEERKESKRPPTVNDFCEEKGISRSFFYKLKLPYAKAGARSITTAENRDGLAEATVSITQILKSLRRGDRAAAPRRNYERAHPRDQGHSNGSNSAFSKICKQYLLALRQAV